MSPAQFSQLRPGDIVRSGSGVYRRVLRVKHLPPWRSYYPPRCYVTFAKVHQPNETTTYVRADLLTNRYRYIGARSW